MTRLLRVTLWVLDFAAASVTTRSVSNAKGEVDRATRKRRAVAALDGFEHRPETSPYAAAR